jgi:hypothetical protein
MNRKRTYQTILIVAMLLCVSMPVYASLFYRVSLANMVNRAQYITHGTVTKVESRWNEDQTVIFSYVTIHVQSMIKGRLQTEDIIVKEAGGTVDGLVATPIGFPEFKIAQEVILFLTRWENDQALRVLEYTQGKYNVINNVLTGEKSILREDVALGSTEFIGLPSAADEELTKVMPMEKFLKKISDITKNTAR